ncbi:MAG: DUF3667 domain-containing protein [Kangiellaceae bacterium]
MNKCKNCERNFEGKFCNNCGQKSRVSRVDYKYLLNEISENLLQVNHGFFYTLKELSLRPGKNIRSFLEGKRVSHFKPLAYLLLTSTLYVLAIFFLDLNTVTNDLVSGFTTASSNDGTEIGSTALSFFDWLAKNHTFMLLLTIPLFSLASYIAFIKSGYNYFEHLVLNIYITGQQMIIYLLLSTIVTKDEITEIIPFSSAIIFNFWAYYQFFQLKNSHTKIFLTLLTYVIFSIQLLILILVGLYLVNLK